MPRTELLWLPLIGGYLFATFLYSTKYYIARKSGYDLIFVSAAWGVGLLGIARLLFEGLESQCLRNCFGTFPYPLNASKNAMTAGLSFIMGGILPRIFNRIGDRIQKKSEDLISRSKKAEKQNNITEARECHIQSQVLKAKLRFQWLTRTGCINREITRMQDDLRILLRDAMGTGACLCVTLGTGKVYLGEIAALFDPLKPIESIRFILHRSGYREQATGALKWKVNYKEILDKVSIQDYSQNSEDLRSAYRGLAAGRYGRFRRMMVYIGILTIEILSRPFRALFSWFIGSICSRYIHLQPLISLEQVSYNYNNWVERVIEKKATKAIQKHTETKMPKRPEIILAFSEIKTVHEFFEEVDDHCSPWDKEQKVIFT